MARAFVAKAVYDLPTTRGLRDRLDTDVVLRRICGWERKFEVPSESVFSRAFAEFSDTQLPQRVHEALIGNTHRDRLVGHLSRDSTAIEAREKPAAKQKAPPPPKRKRGRPKKGEERPKVLKRLDRQSAMSLPEMLDDLPTDCDVGMKKDSKGYKSTWVEVAPVSWTPILLGGRRSIRDAEDEIAVCGGVPATDGRPGSVRTCAGGPGSRVRAVVPGDPDLGRAGGPRCG